MLPYFLVTAVKDIKMTIKALPRLEQDLKVAEEIHHKIEAEEDAWRRRIRETIHNYQVITIDS